MATSEADGGPGEDGRPGGGSGPQPELDVGRLAGRLAEAPDAQQRIRALLGAILDVSAKLDLSVVLRRIVVTAMELAGARYGALGVLDSEGTALAEFIPVGLDEEETDRLAGVALPHGRGLLGLLISDPRPLRVDDIAAHPRAAGLPPGHPPMRSLLGVAITVRGSVYGNLYLTDRRDARPFDDDDEAVVVALASAAGVAIENARLYERLRSGAEQFQRLLLPSLPDLAPFTSWSLYQPATEPALLGGDWYDALALPGGARAMIVGDVVGHDVRAAAGMAQVRNMLRALAYDADLPPGALLSRLDRTLAGVAEPTMATVCVARIAPTGDGAGWSLLWSSAGHPPPLLVTADGRARYLEGEPDLPLGVDPLLARADHRHELPAGATVLMFTDGLVEHPRRDLGETLGIVADVAAAHAHGPLESLGQAVARARPSDGHDDMAVLALRAPAGGAPGAAPVMATGSATSGSYRRRAAR
ncbi:GAF domain-containing SpoIIE family protein phosphatase [Streptomyces sp. NPDC046261]|uniref:PP2C family protein-serine/threonine phosphatase n=1 Tax=Streptomyces sp. NPDC046261 TaxID=3157200 RepID=UPI0033E50A70